MSTATLGRPRDVDALRERVRSLATAYDTQTTTFEVTASRLRAARWWFLAAGFALGVAARGLVLWAGWWR